MWQVGFIGIAAGAASALLFASFASRSLFSLLLTVISPLPILLAVLGWNHIAGALAAFLAALFLAVVIGPTTFLVYLIGIGLPAWWLGYLALLGRTDAAGQLEWYPIGNLVVWAAILMAGVLAIGVLTMESDIDALRAKARQALEASLRILNSGSPDPSRNASGLAMNYPLVLGAIATGANTTILIYFNVWLAGRIASLSGHLKRPWPDVPSMEFSPLVAFGLVVAFAGTFVLSGLSQVIAALFFGAFLIAVAVLGLAVVHAITRGVPMRPLVLGAVYFAVLFMGASILLVVLGLVEMVFNLRRRFRPPASPQT
jgi:hypothetical protein